jgi:hypothetical protein
MASLASGAKLVPNVLNQANQSEVLSCLILANRRKFFVLGILSVLRLDRGVLISGP